MKKTIFLLAVSLFIIFPAIAQMQIMQENFGSSAWDGNPSNYPDYTSSAIFGGDDSHAFSTANSSGYSEASGGVAVYMGSWSGVENTTFVMQFNTDGYINVQLSFGLKHNSGGWGTCQLTNNYTKIEYSTDSTNWTTLDKANLKEGSSWPCADEGLWAYIELAEVLPSDPTLNIRITHTNPDTHPFYIDDITLIGYPPDNTDPSTPTNLNADSIDYNSFILSWNASTDNIMVKSYDIYKDGYYLMSTTDTIAEVKHQSPGSTADYSVIAYDIADNASSESSALPVTLDTKPIDFKYSWQEAQAKVKSGGDIEWQPDSFIYRSGPSVRYIDYEGGDDSNDGLTKSTPWKHHPWDNSATGNAASCSGIHTYVFKRGVVYRGTLTAQESGTPLNPIRLTSDPSWGNGKACFYGSQQITSGWTKADASSAPNIPEPDKVWYKDITLPETKTVCEIDGENIKGLHVARSPNFRHTPDDPLKSWWEWTAKNEDGSGNLWLSDNNNLTQDNQFFYYGATVFSQEDAIVMCTIWHQDVTEWDPDNNRIKVDNINFGGSGSKYFIENTPFLLDTTNEFYYDIDNERLFVRLDGEKDPNTTIIEAATKDQLIEIDSKHDIEISGLSFGITTSHSIRYGQEDAKATIKLTGINHNINIDNNEFHYVNGGVALTNTGSASLNTHSVTVSDNDFQYVGDLAIVYSSNTVYMDNMDILRNNIYYCGYRHQGRWYGSIPAIFGQLNYGEVAGNVIDYSWGNGIDMFWGKGGGSDDYVPFIRGFIHHNKASNTLIGTNDYGGIESWQGGPTYCYNNYSHNASGYKHYNNSSIGYAYYFDGAFKHIVFNNIASGVSHNRNAASIMQVLGFYNMYIHNTGYNTDVFLNAWKGTLALNGHNTYLGNIAEDIESFFKHEISSSDIPFDAYGHNVSSGSSFIGSLENRDNNLSLSQFQSKLESYDAQLTQTGWNAGEEVIINPQVYDFRPKENSTAVDSGVTFFTAFPLAKVVGEWNFYEHPSDPSIIMADNFYMTSDYNDRTTYKNVPKNHLNAYNIVDTSFIKGDLEDWTEGALVFDGAVYCDIKHSAASANKSNDVDMTDNNFIIEAYLKTKAGHTNGVIVSKYESAEGYEMDIDGSGMARIRLYEGGAASVSRSSNTAINDGNWHHVLAEVNRRSTINIFIDGTLSNGSLTGAMPASSASLTNTSDLLVGNDADNNYFHGIMDFLRISKGNLYDAKTSIDELYTWQTDGPFLYDIKGEAPVGKRNAGALEATIGTCNLDVSKTSLNFDEYQETDYIIVTADNGFIIQEKAGNFFSTSISDDTIKVSVSENIGSDDNSGSITVAGCNSTQVITISQQGAACSFTCNTDTLILSTEAQTAAIGVNTNGSISVNSNLSFGIASVEDDSVKINVSENTEDAKRTGEVEINNCSGIHTVTLIQEGMLDVKNGKPAGLFIYPNPVKNGYLNIELPKNNKQCNYTITDLTGKVEQTGKIFNNRATLKFDLAPGVYIIKLNTDKINYQTKITVL